MMGKPKIRFKGYNEDWEQRKLGDIIEVCSGRDYKHLEDGNIPVYGTGGYMPVSYTHLTLPTTERV